MDRYSRTSSSPVAQAQPGGLSLIFAAGHRPGAEDILRLTQTAERGAASFSIRHPPPAPGRLDLHTAGLTFHLTGLNPAAPAPMPVIAHRYGFAKARAVAPGEAIALLPGEPGRGGPLLPAVRTMAAMAAELAELAHAAAVVWHPACTAIAPPAFAAMIADWLADGAFPALGLTALFRDETGAICSEGLAFFTGQELRIEAFLGISTVQLVKIAARFVNQLVGIDPINQPFETLGPSGEQLCVEPPGSDGYLRIWRKS